MSEPRDTLKPPPSEHADLHARILARLASMTESEFARSMVEAGIRTSEGKLTPEYAEEPAKETSAT